MAARDVRQIVALLRALLTGLALGTTGTGGWWLWATVIALTGPAARAIAANAVDPHDLWAARRDALARTTRTRP